jgi:hypothetical protein
VHLDLTVAIAAEQLLRSRTERQSGKVVEPGRLSIHNLNSGYPLSSILLPRAFSPILTHRLSCSPFDITTILLYPEWEKVDYVKFI